MSKIILRISILIFILCSHNSALAQQGVWLRLAPTLESRQEVAVAELDGKIYLIGGLVTGGVSRTVEVYDPDFDKWTSVAPLPEPLHHSSAVSLDGKLYVIGGYNTSSFTPVRSAYRYDPVLNEWSAIASLPRVRGALASVAIDNKIYTVGGNGQAGSELTVYDPVGNNWTLLAPMPTPREHIAAGAVNGKLYVAGGRNATSFTLNTLEEYDPLTNAWRARAPMPTGRSGIAGAVINGRFYVFGGEGNRAVSTGVFSQNESYDPLTNTWRTETPMPLPRHGIGAVAFDGLIFIPSGAPVQGFSRTNLHDAYIPPESNVGPIITGATPTSAMVGASVTITGINFDNVTSVDFNGTGATFDLLSSNSIRAIVPFGATTGRITVSSLDDSISSRFIFRVLPQITGFEPASGIIGESITIKGINLLGVTAVRFGALNANFEPLSYSEIRATVPSNATTSPVSVITPDGTATGNFIILRPPTIGSFSPSIGVIGAAVTISGTNISGITDVKFNGVSAGAPQVISATLIRTVVPAFATTGRITIENRAGAATSAGTFRVLPRIIGFTPNSGIAGESVTITGTNLGSKPTVRIGSAIASVTSATGLEIAAIIPATAFTGRISVTTADGTATSTAIFTVIKPPTIGSFSPLSAAVGSAVTISGSNISSVTEVIFNGVSAGTPTLLSATLIRSVVPNEAGTGKITVINPAGMATSTGIFRVLPRISAFTPGSALPGEAVAITGMNFTGATAVRFGSALASNFSVDSDTQITVNVPHTAVTARVSITTPSGTGLSANNFIVIRTPVISSFSPLSGAVGTAVTLFGSNLISAMDVRFMGAGGEISAGPITFLGLSSIRVNVPAGAITGKIKVVNRASPQGVMSAGTFTVVP